jgi:Ala-tRNA(Pro) deacylase
MSISTRVARFLDDQGIEYDTLDHPHANTATNAALAAHVLPKSVAKAVVLEDHDNRYLMAILPADHKLNLHKLNNKMQVDLHLVDECHVYEMFSDCEPGAVPAIAPAYNMKAIYDETLDQLDDIYLEGGDHETFIHLEKTQFGKLMSEAQRSRFSSLEYY